MRPQHKGGAPLVLRDSVPLDEWSRLRPDYEALIADESRDSAYLREVGLQRNIMDLIGDCATSTVLDVGSGNGWLLDAIKPRLGFECDCVTPSRVRSDRDFSIQDIRCMTYRDSAFDVVVASLVLMWIDELEAACRELERVTCPGGRVVVALVHPFAYRTGVVDDDGTFRVTRRYGAPFVLEDLYIAGSVGPFRYFHRPLSDYLNALAATGLQLRAFHEWSIDMTDYINHVQPLSDHPRRTDRVPMYAFLAWEKPAP